MLAGVKQMQQQTARPSVAFGTFCREINQDTLSRTFEVFADLKQRRYSDIHVMFHSTGGLIPEGIALFNYFKSLPLELHLYNPGAVASAAVTAFVGARYRYASKQATFLLHKVASAERTSMRAVEHQALAHALTISDTNNEAILKSIIKMPQEKWTAYENAYATITAQEALECGLITEILDFQPLPDAYFFDV
jgi:ATP-dependent Clp protease protease subunit